MAGFGRTLMNVAAGALGGYGDYLTTRGKLEEQDRQEQAQSQRAMALEQFRASIQANRDEKQNEYRRGEIVLSGIVNRANNQAELGTKASLDAANDERDFKIWQQKNKIEFQTWKQRSGIELSNAQKLELYKTEQGIRAEAQKDGMKPVGDDIDEATGTRVLYFRDGNNQVKAYDTGIVVQQKSETNPLTGDVTRTTNKPTKTATPGWRDGGGSSTGGAAGAGGKTRTTLDIALDQLATDYASGRPLVVNGRKLSIGEAQALARQRYGG